MNLPPPHFICIGAQRSGTSWMYECFLEHPDIFMPQKEMQFFNNHPLSELPSYLSKFTETDKVNGEITPDYLACQPAIDKIASACKHTKLIVILRNPIERTKSSLQLYRERGITTESSVEEVIKNNSAPFVDSLYGKQIEHLFSVFNPELIKVVFFERIKSEPLQLIQELYEFIGVDAAFCPQSASRNFNASSVGFGSKNIAKSLTVIQNYLHKRPWGRQILKIKRTALFGSFKASLVKRNTTELSDMNSSYYPHYAEDIAKLESQLGYAVPDSWKVK